MTYKFNTQLGTQNFTIGIDVKSKYGYFEHDTLGDNRSISFKGYNRFTQYI